MSSKKALCISTVVHGLIIGTGIAVTSCGSDSASRHEIVATTGDEATTLDIDVGISASSGAALTDDALSSWSAVLQVTTMSDTVLSFTADASNPTWQGVPKYVKASKITFPANSINFSTNHVATSSEVVVGCTSSGQRQFLGSQNVNGDTIDIVNDGTRRISLSYLSSTNLSQVVICPNQQTTPPSVAIGASTLEFRVFDRAFVSAACLADCPSSVAVVNTSSTVDSGPNVMSGVGAPSVTIDSITAEVDYSGPKIRAVLKATCSASCGHWYGAGDFTDCAVSGPGAQSGTIQDSQQLVCKSSYTAVDPLLPAQPLVFGTGLGIQFISSDLNNGSITRITGDVTLQYSVTN